MSSVPSPSMRLPAAARAKLLDQAERRGLYAERYDLRGAALALQSNTSPEILIAGPAGTGKSIASLVKLHRRASHERIRGLIARKTRVSLTGSGLVTWEQKVVGLRHPVVTNGPSRAQRQSYTYSNGSEIVVAGLDNPTRIMSTEFDVIYIQEATELGPEEWESVTTRFRGGVDASTTQLLADCNPDSDTHWLYQRCLSGATTLLQSVHEDNPYLYDAARREWTPAGVAYMDRLDNLTGVRKERLRYGRWVGAEGMVYDDWSPRLHVISRADLPTMRYYVASQDWGYTNPGVLQVWGVDGDGRMYLVKEHYRTQKSIEWWKTTAYREWETYRFVVITCDPAEPGFIAEYRASGLPGRPMLPGLPALPAFNGIALGVQAVQARLAPTGDGRPRLFVCADALDSVDSLLPPGKPRWSLEERPRYVWALGANGKATKEEPVDDNNHGMDAERYAVAHVDHVGVPASHGGRPVAAAPRLIVDAARDQYRRFGVR